MVVLMSMQYPGTKLDEVASLSMEWFTKSPLPEYVALKDSYCMTHMGGIKVLILYEISEQNAKEGVDYAEKSALFFLKRVEGLDCYTKVAYPLMEAYSMIEMPAPEL